MGRWPIEEIPPEHDIYLRVHKKHVDGGRILDIAFKNRADSTQPERRAGMSMDWCKYSSPEDARQRARVPADNGIVKLNVGVVRLIPLQEVEHTPEPGNRAHTEVFGPKSPNDVPNEDASGRMTALEVRVRLRDAAEWVIKASAVPAP